MNIHLTILDWWIIGGFFAFTILIGIVVAKVASKSQEEFFLGGRNMPWWLLGFSMVATTFSTDTPNLVTDFVRRYGVFGNWSWWCMLPTGMLTEFPEPGQPEVLEQPVRQEKSAGLVDKAPQEALRYAC